MWIDLLTVLTNPDVVNATLEVKKDLNSNFVASMNLTLGHNLSHVIALYNFSTPKDKNDKNYTKMIIKRSIDICRISKGKSNNMVDQIGKMMLDEIVKYADFEVKCPFTAGEIHMKNLVINNHYIPKFLVSEKFKFSWYCKLMGKIESKPKFFHIFTLKAIGSIKGD